jgi:hypothetical protein
LALSLAWGTFFFPAGSIFLTYALDGCNLFGSIGVEYDHALRAASGNPNVIDRAADQSASVCHEHDLVAVVDRHCGNELAVSLIDRHGDDTFAAAAGDAVFVR